MGKLILALVVLLIEIGLLTAMMLNYFTDETQKAIFDGVLVLVNRAVIGATVKAMN